MGLDLVPEGKAKQGREAEWRAIMTALFAGRKIDAATRARFSQIIIHPYEVVGAPRVGSDKRADEWIVAKLGTKTDEEIAARLQELQGYYVLELANSPGVPRYSNGWAAGSVDLTSFRGQFLKDCVGDGVPARLVERAWEHKWPEQAVAYGDELLRAAASAPKLRTIESRSLLRRLGFIRARSSPAREVEVADVPKSAGEWHKFWGQRGHPIFAYY